MVYAKKTTERSGAPGKTTGAYCETRMAKRTHKTDSERLQKRQKRIAALMKHRTAVTVLLACALTALLTVLIVGIYVLAFAVSYVNGEAKVNLEEYKQNQDQTTFIYAYDDNGETVQLARLHGEQNRVWVTYREYPEESTIPQNLANAYIALEDKRFYSHHGVDWFRTLSAVIKDRGSTGGSTITQQLIKNLTGENKRTLNRKFYEILMALNLEKNVSKETVLEAYMNTVYMSHGCYGVQTAAETYFGKNVQDLNLAECASLAAITQSPSKNDPLLHPEENRKRQLTCLANMEEEGMITKEEREAAEAYEMVFTNSEGYTPSGDLASQQVETEKSVWSYYVDYVIQSVRDDLVDQYGYSRSQASSLIYSGGLRIYAAVDLDVQEAMESVYVNRTGFPKYNKHIDDAQSAMTIMDYSGRIVGMVGGAGEKTENRGLNRAANSYRQPGSSIKPLTIYAPAMQEKQITWSTKIENYGIKNYYSDGRYGPVNYGDDPGSPGSYVTVQKALAISYNTVPAQILQDLGFNTSFEYATQKFHLSHLVDPTDKNTSSLAVGGTYKGVSTLEMAAAFAAFGNGGKYFEPYCYYQVTNSNGSEVLLRHNETEGEQAISADTADVMNELLQTVVTDRAGQATARNYGLENSPLFAKTGTTSEDKDRWFVGGTPYYVAAVWFGCDTPKQISNYVSGNPAGSIFDEVMDRVHENLERKEFQKFSPIVEQRTYCTASGLLASDGCTSRATGWYSKENLPGTCKQAHASTTPPATSAPAGEGATQPAAAQTTAPSATQPADGTPETTAPAA